MWKLHFKRTVIFGILGLAIALTIGLLSPKIYEGQTALLVGEDMTTRGGFPTMTQDVLSILERGSPRTPETELGVLSSQGVLWEALRAVAVKRNDGDMTKDFVKYYRMYSVSGQEKSNVASISVKAYSPEIAAELANEVANAYNQVRKSNARAAINDALNYLNEQITKTQQELNDAEQKLQAYRTTNKITDIGIETSERVRNLENFKVQAAQLEAQLQGADSEVSEYETQLAQHTTENKVSLIAAGKSQAVGQFQSQLAALKNEREQLLGRFMPDAIEVKNKESEIRAVEKLLKAEEAKKMTVSGENTQPEPVRQDLKNGYVRAKIARSNLRANLAEVKNKIEEFQANLDKIPADQGEMVKLSRNLELADGQYRKLKGMSDDLKNRADVSVRAAQIIFTARPDEEPVAPDIMKFALIGTLAGVCLGLIFSFGRESLKLRVHTSVQLAELTGLPVAATVPALPRAQMARSIRRLTQANGQPAESFRYMAFSMLAADPHLKRTMMFTSSGNIQGASSCGLQLAVAVARTGKKVLLVDANVRRGVITGLLDMNSKQGLTDLIAGGNFDAGGMGAFVVDTVHTNLSLLPAGTKREIELTNMSEADFDRMIEQIKGLAEVVIIDAAPCDMVADASRLAKSCDDVCLVISARSTNFRSVPSAYEILTRAGAKSVSLVLVDASLDDEPFSNAGRFITPR